MRKLIVCCAVAALLIGTLAGCDLLDNLTGGGNPAAGGPPPDAPIVTPGVGVPEEDLDFELTPGQDPAFGAGLEDVPDFAEPEVPVDAMYEIRGDYAYQLDPATLEIIDVPLDPVTHLPVDVGEGEVVDAMGDAELTGPDVISTPEPMPSEVPDIPPAETQAPSAVEPTEDTKYPNTGIFLEDD